jgi:hypothetical protein
VYTPRYGRVELRCRATDDPEAMVALWLIGYEDEAERSGELCVCELFGRDVGPDEAVVGLGVHPFGDPELEDDFRRICLPIDAREPHDYAAQWSPDGAVFLVDGEEVARLPQAPSYPLQLMLSLYAFAPPSAAASRPQEFVVEHVRGWALE